MLSRPAAQQLRLQPSQSHRSKRRRIWSFDEFGGFSDAGRLRHSSRKPGQRRRRRGRMSSPTRNLAVWSPNRAAATPGPATAARTNSRPGANDPVTDHRAKSFTSATKKPAIWTPTPLPLRDAAEYGDSTWPRVTRFTHRARGIQASLLVSIAPKACVKFACLKLRNDKRSAATLSATYFAEWVLGVSRRSDADARRHFAATRDGRIAGP